MSTRIRLAGAVFAASVILAACSGSQEQATASAASAPPVAEAASSAPSEAPPAPRTPVSPQLSTPHLDRVVSHATTVLVDAQDRCNKLTGPLRDGCHKQAQAFYEAAVEKGRNPPPPIQR